MVPSFFLLVFTDVLLKTALGMEGAPSSLRHQKVFVEPDGSMQPPLWMSSGDLDKTTAHDVRKQGSQVRDEGLLAELVDRPVEEATLLDEAMIPGGGPGSGPGFGQGFGPCQGGSPTTGGTDINDDCGGGFGGIQFGSSSDFCAPDPTPSSLDTVLQITNQKRSEKGVKPLKRNPSLDKAAQAHSEDRANNCGGISHSGCDGSSPSQRCQAHGYPSGCGENVALGQKTAQSVMQSWWCSSGHKANILNSTYTEIGLGVSGDFWTQTFGSGKSFGRAGKGSSGKGSSGKGSSAKGRRGKGRSP
jgi:hypothetical protein